MNSNYIREMANLHKKAAEELLKVADYMELNSIQI